MNGIVPAVAPCFALSIGLLFLAPRPAAAAEERLDTTLALPMGADGSDAWSEIWQQIDGSGSWRVDYFSSSKNLDDEHHFLDASLQLKARPEFSERLRGAMEFRLSQSTQHHSSTSGRVIEAYLTATFAHADLRLGKQIVAWGRADGINPTDNLTPRDYTVRLPFENDERQGTTAATLDLYVTPDHTLTIFVTPFFEPTVVPLPRAGYEIIDRTPAASLSNTQAGMRLDKVGESLDWSVSYYRGFSLFPSVSLPLTHAGATPVMALTYDRINVVGADVARNYGRFGVRAEIGYFDTRDDRGRDPVVKNAQLYWIAGVDRTFHESLNFNLQYFQRRIRDYRDSTSHADPVQRSTALINATFNGQRDAVNDGISFRVSNQWLHDTLEAEIFGVVNLTRDDSFIRAAINYAMNDRCTLTVGGEHYRGDVDTQYGSLARNSSAFVEVRYGF